MIKLIQKKAIKERRPKNEIYYFEIDIKIDV